MKVILITLLVTLSTMVHAQDSTLVRFNLNKARANIFSASAHETGLITAIDNRRLNQLEWLPTDYGCMLFKWGNEENQKKWMQKIINNDIELYDVPIVEFVGVTPSDENLTCLVDSIKYYDASNKPANTTTEKPPVTVEGSNSSDSKQLPSLEVDVRAAAYVELSQGSSGTKLEPAIKLTYSMRGIGPMRKLGIHCSAFIPKSGFQSLGLDNEEVNSLRGKLLFTDVSISDGICFFGGMSQSQ